MRAISIGKAIAQVLAPPVRNVSFDYQQMTDRSGSRAILKTIGLPMCCPHCNNDVPANTGHACKRHGKGFTFSNTPL